MNDVSKTMTASKRSEGLFNSFAEGEVLICAYREKFDWYPILKGEEPRVQFSRDGLDPLAGYCRNSNVLTLDTGTPEFSLYLERFYEAAAAFSKDHQAAANVAVFAALRAYRALAVRLMMEAARLAVCKMEKMTAPVESLEAALDAVANSKSCQYQLFPEAEVAMREAIGEAKDTPIGQMVAELASRKPMTRSPNPNRSVAPWVQVAAAGNNLTN